MNFAGFSAVNVSLKEIRLCYYFPSVTLDNTGLANVIIIFLHTEFLQYLILYQVKQALQSSCSLPVPSSTFQNNVSHQNNLCTVTMLKQSVCSGWPTFHHISGDKAFVSVQRWSCVPLSLRVCHRLQNLKYIYNCFWA